MGGIEDAAAQCGLSATSLSCPIPLAGSRRLWASYRWSLGNFALFKPKSSLTSHDPRRTWELGSQGRVPPEMVLQVRQSCLPADPEVLFVFFFLPGGSPSQQLTPPRMPLTCTLYTCPTGPLLAVSQTTLKPRGLKRQASSVCLGLCRLAHFCSAWHLL